MHLVALAVGQIVQAMECLEHLVLEMAAVARGRRT
jgi:hypothetical protein